jgi:DNA-binding FadR family transcriptional regulator
MFRTARQNRVYQDIVEQIQRAIMDRKLNPGDMLPPERELKEVFKTSRGTLREALRVLQEKGLIEIRLGTGGGAVIKDFSTDQMSETLALMIRFQKVSLEHLAEFREGVEGSVVTLAVRRAQSSDLRELRKLLADAKMHADAGISHWEEFLESDKKLHVKLAQISGNPVYLFVYQTIHDNIHLYYEEFLPGDAEMMRENYQDLSDMVAAVEQKDERKARRLTQIHIQRFFRYMKENDASVQALDGK